MNCLNVSTSVKSSCLQIDVKKCNNPFVANIQRYDQLSVNAYLKDKHPKVTIDCVILTPDVDVTFVCNTSLGHIYFLVKEGLFILSDGKKFELIKDEQLSK